jgi:hypothetical protein
MTLRSPEEIREFLRRRFNSQHRNWFNGEGSWPLHVMLGAPAEREVAADFRSVRSWIESWRQWQQPGEIVWEMRQWLRMGDHHIPVALRIDSPDTVAAIIGEHRRWQTAHRRRLDLSERYPALKNGQLLARCFPGLADYDEADFGRLSSLLSWLERNPQSGLYVRQIPVSGLDTKWMETRQGLIADLLRAVGNRPVEGDFFSLCGLRVDHFRVRARFLCPSLRQHVGGLQDIEAPLSEFASLSLAPERVILVENLATGLALPDIPGTVAFMKLGNAVGVLGQIPWLCCNRMIYWGDIDTHGFAILDRARRAFPQIRSILMDRMTLLAHPDLWGQETTQVNCERSTMLTPEEQEVCRGLFQQQWGIKLRLEQERIPWATALNAVRETFEQPL